MNHYLTLNPRSFVHFVVFSSSFSAVDREGNVSMESLVEAVRKGIERVNGVVKGRFRIFMLPIML